MAVLGRSAATAMLVLVGLGGGTPVAFGQAQPRTTYNSFMAHDAMSGGQPLRAPGFGVESGKAAPSSDQLRGSVFDARTGRVRPGNPSPSIR